MSGRRRDREGFTLTEILIASVILALCSVPVIGAFIMSKRGITNTDERRTIRFHMEHILSKANRTSLHYLWMNFGPPSIQVTEPDGTLVGVTGKMKDRIAELDETNGLLKTGNPQDTNPLGFTENYLRQLYNDGFDARLHYEFYTAKELGIGPSGEASDTFGILHMQAGYVKLTLLDRLSGKTDQDKEVVGEWTQPIMCPAIVGRPGLRLSSCPAIAEDVKKSYGKALEQYEAGLGG